MHRLIVAIAIITVMSATDLAGETVMNSQSTTLMDKTYKQIPFEKITGETTSLNDFDGKVVLIVNVASKCGFTPQYKELQELYLKYKDEGFEIIGFPANNFMNQEPGTNEEIAQFCEVNYGVTFPMMSKISVKGNSIHPLYKYLTEESTLPGEVKWNFSKFLLDAKHNLVARFDSKVEPMSEEITAEIEKLIKN